MEGHKKVIDELNKNLSAELSAVLQYIVESEMCSNWGYKDISKLIKLRAIDEMKHGEALIERILFLGGTPIVTAMKDINIGKNISEILKNDHEAEELAIESYNESIAIALEVGDNGSKAIFESNLSGEETHINTIEENLTILKDVGLANYLTIQVKD